MTQLEKDAIGVTGPARKGELQRDLHMKVELWERLDDRMKDLQKVRWIRMKPPALPLTEKEECKADTGFRV